MMDLKIAQIKKEYRRREKEDRELEAKNADERYMTTEQIMERFKRNAVILTNMVLRISVRHICSGQLQIHYIDDFYNTQYDDLDSFTYVKEKYKLNLSGKMYINESIAMTMAQWESKIYATLTQHMIFPDHTTRFQQGNLECISYVSRMPDGIYYNLVYRICGTTRTWSGNARCERKYQQTLGRVLEAIIRTIRIEGEQHGERGDNSQ